MTTIDIVSGNWTTIKEEDISAICNGGINPLIRRPDELIRIAGHEQREQAEWNLKVDAESRQRRELGAENATSARDMTLEEAWKTCQTLPRYGGPKEIMPGLATCAQLLAVHGNTSCRAECQNIDDLIKCVNLLGDYNEHDATLCAGTLRRFNKMAYYGSNNPNTGIDLLHYYFGFEGSHVIYAEMRWIPGHGARVLHSSRRAWREYSPTEFKADCMAAGQSMRADECDLWHEDERSVRWRWWWD